MRTIRARLKRLEAQARQRPSGKCGVVKCQPGESINDAAERAAREGYSGVLVVPGILTLEAWESYAQASNAALNDAHHRLMNGLEQPEEILHRLLLDPASRLQWRAPLQANQEAPLSP